jgi:hypothetical protein
MEKGLKNLQSAYRSAARKSRGMSDHSDDSGIGFEDDAEGEADDGGDDTPTLAGDHFLHHQQSSRGVSVSSASGYALAGPSTMPPSQQQRRHHQQQLQHQHQQQLHAQQQHQQHLQRGMLLGMGGGAGASYDAQAAAYHAATGGGGYGGAGGLRRDSAGSAGSGGSLNLNYAGLPSATISEQQQAAAQGLHDLRSRGGGGFSIQSMLSPAHHSSGGM